MSNNFNWQTEDDVVWDDEAMAAETAVSRHRPWLTFLIIMIAIVAAGALIYRQVDERVEVATGDVESDIFASHQLLQQAALQNDIELFKTLLSGRSAAWSSLQTELMSEGRFYDRELLGLGWLPPTDVNNDSPAIELDIAPEFNAAELRFTQEYAVAVGNGVTETVILQQTAVYRRGSQRWLYAPPDDEFWGEFTTNQGVMLTMAYPARDAVIAERLAFDLDAKLNEMCRILPGLDCPDDLRVHLRLSDDLNSVWSFDSTTALAGSFRLELPTPTVVGLPVDEAGYQALYRGYATRLVTAVIPQLVGYECCEQAVFFQALLDYQLSRLGLRPWSVTAADYARVISEDVTIGDMSLIWRRARVNYLFQSDGWQIYAVIDFLTQRYPETAVADMQRLIPHRSPFTTWLERVRGSNSTLSESPDFLQTFEREWRQYAYQQTIASQEPPPISFPEQDVYLLCSSAIDQIDSNLYQLRLDTMEWDTHVMGAGILYANPLPQDDGLLLQTMEFDNVEAQTTIWRDGVNQLLMNSEHISLGQFDPSSERMLVYSAYETPNAILVDVAACADGGCPLHPLAGLPVWSPGGSDFILMPHEALFTNPFVVNGRIFLFDMETPLQEWPLYRGEDAPVTADMDDMIRIGGGYAPFWLDETTYGYVRQIPISSNSNDHELVLASVFDDTPRVLFTDADLLTLLLDGEGLPDFDINIRFTISHPTQPDTLFIAAFSSRQMASLFSYNVKTDEMKFLFQADLGRYRSFGLSPDGRYLTLAKTIVDTSDRARGESVLLHNIASNEAKTFGLTEPFFFPANSYDWSADGDWLIIALNDRDLLLVAPDYDYQHLIPHGLGNCTNVVWLNQ